MALVDAEKLSLSALKQVMEEKVIIVQLFFFILSCF